MDVLPRTMLPARIFTYLYERQDNFEYLNMISVYFHIQIFQKYAQLGTKVDRSVIKSYQLFVRQCYYVVSHLKWKNLSYEHRPR